jgi:hypothetical protein
MVNDQKTVASYGEAKKVAQEPLKNKRAAKRKAALKTTRPF